MLVLHLGEVVNKHIEYHLMVPNQIYFLMIFHPIDSAYTHF